MPHNLATCTPTEHLGIRTSTTLQFSTACPNPPTSTNACWIDGQLASGRKSGYNFGATGTSGGYYAYATPVTANSTGVRSFCSIADAVVRYVSSGTISTCAGTETPLE